MKTISVRVSDEVTSKLDNIAKIEDRDRSYLINRAISDYIDLYEWQMAEIEKGLKQIDQGDIINEAEANTIIKEFNNSK